MKLLYVTDMHLSEQPPPGRSTNPFYEVGIRKLEALINHYKPDAGIIGGDVFHTCTPSIKTIITLKEVLQVPWPWLGYDDGNRPRWDIIPGNHDLPYNRIDHRRWSPLSLLDHEMEVDVISSIDCLGIGMTMVLGVPYGVDLQRGPFLSCYVVVLHDAYSDKPDPLLGVKNWCVLREAYPNAKLFLTGHIHQQLIVEQDGVALVNPGPLVRRTVDELQRIERPAGVVVEIDGAQVSWEMAYVDECEGYEPFDDLVDRPERPTIDLSQVVSSLPKDMGTLDKSKVGELVAQMAERYGIEDDAILELLGEILSGADN
jgi:DNA repair exonuclease SbcCD nuclease subunit